MALWLVVELPGSSPDARRLEGDGPFSVGRGAGCDLRLPHPTVSSVHFDIDCKGGAIRVRDQGSSHGTWIGTEPVPAGEWRTAEEGDELWAGEVRIRVGGGFDPAATEGEPTVALPAASLPGATEAVAVRFTAPDGAAASFAVARGAERTLIERDLPAARWPSLRSALPITLSASRDGVRLRTADGRDVGFHGGEAELGGVCIDLASDTSPLLASRVEPSPFARVGQMRAEEGAGDMGGAAVGSTLDTAARGAAGSPATISTTSSPAFSPPASRVPSAGAELRERASGEPVAATRSGEGGSSAGPARDWISALAAVIGFLALLASLALAWLLSR